MEHRNYDTGKPVSGLLNVHQACPFIYSNSCSIDAVGFLFFFWGDVEQETSPPESANEDILVTIPMDSNVELLRLPHG